MKNGKGYALFAAGVLLVAAAGYGIGVHNGRSGVEDAVQQLAQAKREIAVIEKENAQLHRANVRLSEEALLYPRISDAINEALKENGINGIDALLQSLRDNPGVIPTRPVLGGTMMFTDMGIVNEQWVYAAFEDGHISGAAVFRWELQNGRIVWTPVVVSEK